MEKTGCLIWVSGVKKCFFLIKIVLNQGISAIPFRKPPCKNKRLYWLKPCYPVTLCSNITKVNFSYHIKNLNSLKPFFWQFLNVEFVFWQLVFNSIWWSHSEFMGKIFQAAQLTHERFLTIFFRSDLWSKISHALVVQLETFSNFYCMFLNPNNFFQFWF